ncbi:MAG: sulfite exporter TauE/SafE family protein [Gloeobacteraceae cyanobacterium ES-bin-144]|nr:sulfite exporter TauE/SafE family protein [Verrucomicrobiales bacterium]
MTTEAALVFGLATSLHCVGMCGPIACGLGTLAKSEGERLTAASLYHGTRLLSYGIIGAVCGALGQQPLQWFFDSPAVLLPWVLVLVLLIMAFGLDKKIPLPTFLNRFTARTRFKASKLSAYGSASLMGFLTPLLPCGYLYLLFASALLAGSAAKGAEFTIAFGLGTVPLLWLAQHQFHRIRNKLTPLTMLRLRRGLAFVTALILAWRLHGTIPAPLYGGTPPATPPVEKLPSCCH